MHINVNLRHPTINTLQEIFKEITSDDLSVNDDRIALSINFTSPYPYRNV